MAVETVRPTEERGEARVGQRAPLPVGLAVRVRNRFEDRWCPGFSVAAHDQGRYQLRRSSDGCILPAWFPAEMVRSDEH